MREPLLPFRERELLPLDRALLPVDREPLPLARLDRALLPADREAPLADLDALPDDFDALAVFDALPDELDALAVLRPEPVAFLDCARVDCFLGCVVVAGLDDELAALLRLAEPLSLAADMSTLLFVSPVFPRESERSETSREQVFSVIYPQLSAAELPKRCLNRSRPIRD